MALQLQIVPVGAANFERELDMIGSLLPHFPYIAIDTEYPGTVHRLPAGKTATPAARYVAIKANVDELPIVQLGITICDEEGKLLSVTVASRTVEFAWEFHFSDFDVRRHRHAPDSVRFLESQGVDFHAARLVGVPSAAFAAKLAAVLSSLPRWCPQPTWAAFGGAYDYGYMVKLLSGGRPLPETWHEFLAGAKCLLRGRLFDAKYMAEHSGRTDLYVGGLRTVAAILGVPQLESPPPCLAGSKSHTACYIYTAMRRVVMKDDDGGAGAMRKDVMKDDDGGAIFDGLIDGFH